jgi:hypothetical protein
MSYELVLALPYAPCFFPFSFELPLALRLNSLLSFRPNQVPFDAFFFRIKTLNLAGLLKIF